MKRSLFVPLCFISGIAVGNTVEFEAPVRMKGGDELIRVESPGYAAPAWTDIDGDGQKDLLVGQFAQGKIRVFKNQGGGTLAEGEWLQAEGATAEVPGVW